MNKKISFNIQQINRQVFLKFETKTDHGFGLLNVIEIIKTFE